ncbi:MAG: hypothetical protein COA78_00745 [Blastopirellula sp.]|nr:MAG: hypothetical protein COA78_00745 [Blastopirellula sp.]
MTHIWVQMRKSPKSHYWRAGRKAGIGVNVSNGSIVLGFSMRGLGVTFRFGLMVARVGNP